MVVPAEVLERAGDAVGPAGHRGSACGAEEQRGAGAAGSEHPAHKPGEQPLTIEEETELFRAQFSRRKRMKLHVVKDLNTSVSHWEITVDEFRGRMQSRFLGVALSGFLVSPILPGLVKYQHGMRAFTLVVGVSSYWQSPSGPTFDTWGEAP